MGESAIVVLKNMKCKKGSEEEYTPIKPISADSLTGGWQVEGKNHEVVFVACQTNLLKSSCCASLFAYSLAEYLYRPICCSESW